MPTVRVVLGLIMDDLRSVRASGATGRVPQYTPTSMPTSRRSLRTFAEHGWPYPASPVSDTLAGAGVSGPRVPVGATGAECPCGRVHPGVANDVGAHHRQAVRRHRLSPISNSRGPGVRCHRGRRSARSRTSAWIPRDHVYAVLRRDAVADPVPADPIVVFDAQGEFVGSWGKQWIADAHGIFITHDDVVFVADRDAHQVCAFSRDGELLRTPREAPPPARAVQSSGRHRGGAGRRHLRRRRLRELAGAPVLVRRDLVAHLGKTGPRALASSGCRTRCGCSATAGCWWRTGRTAGSRCSPGRVNT